MNKISARGQDSTVKIPVFLILKQIKVIYMHSNKIHKVFLLIEFIQHIC